MTSIVALGGTFSAKWVQLNGETLNLNTIDYSIAGCAVPRVLDVTCRRLKFLPLTSRE